MDTEKKQKKGYVAPEMVEVEMFHKRDLCLLECSGDPDGTPGYCDGFN